MPLRKPCAAGLLRPLALTQVILSEFLPFRKAEKFTFISSSSFILKAAFTDLCLSSIQILMIV